MTRKIRIGNVTIGGGEPIRIQSMTNTATSDANATIKQIHELEEAGCEIIRVSVPDQASADALKEIRANTTIPLVADIHFDYKMALESAPYVDKLRINPGNIGSEERIKSVVDKAKEYDLPIRIGCNLGSLERDIEKVHGLTPIALIKSAHKNVQLLEKFNFHNIILSLKASDVPRTVEAYTMASHEFDYPLHLGVTESGSLFSGTIKSSIGIGTLLYNNIGDTIRVSLSADPVEEVKVAKSILQGVGKRRFGVEVTACPTCARTEFDVEDITKQIEEVTKNSKKPIKVSVMGCAVNGPGEAKESNIGIVGGKAHNLLYVDGQIVKKVEKQDTINEILKVAQNYEVKE